MIRADPVAAAIVAWFLVVTLILFLPPPFTPPQPPTYCTTYDRPSGMIVPCQLGWKHWETWLKDGKDI